MSDVKISQKKQTDSNNQKPDGKSVTEYLTFYRLRPNNVVYVDRVIYGGRDYQKRDRRYDEELRKDGRNEILAYGIAFYKKRCKVVVERL